MCERTGGLFGPCYNTINLNSLLYLLDHHLIHYPRGLKVSPVPIPSGRLTLLNTTENADDIAVA